MLDAASADYQGAFDTPIPAGDDRTAEQWARDALEHMPVALYWFVLLGWRVVLGLRLGPRTSPDHIAGWQIAERSHDRVRLATSSWMLTAELDFGKADGKLVWTTFVRYDRRPAAFIWPPVLVLHRMIVPYTLRRAAARSEG
jgi:hypothetical protein